MEDIADIHIKIKKNAFLYRETLLKYNSHGRKYGKMFKTTRLVRYQKCFKIEGMRKTVKVEGGKANKVNFMEFL